MAHTYSAHASTDPTGFGSANQPSEQGFHSATPGSQNSQKPQKRKSEKYMSRRAVALVLCLCMVGSAGLGVGGGYAAYQWAASQDNATASSSQEAAVNTALGSTSSQAQATASTGNAMTVEQIAAAAADSVVEITTEAVSTDQFMQQIISEGAGSGVIFSSDGYIVTNNHVIEGATKLEVTLNDNRKFTAKLVGTDPATDIALLKIDAKGLTVIPFGDSDKLKVGEWVLAIGNPFNLTSTVTAGIVSAKSRGNIGMTGDVSKIESFIQTDAAVNPGNSGGALVNTKGELVGINTAIYSRTGDFSGYSFAVPISIAKKVAADLKEFGVVQRAMLGVSIKSVQGIDEVLNYPNLSASEKEEFEEAKKNVKVTEGVCVMGYATRSGAKEAGIEKYDVITKVNGTTVKTESALQEQISKFRPGDEVEITVDRKGTKKTFKVKLYNTQGNTEVVKSKGDVADVLGAAFEALSDKQKREYGVSCGIEVTGVLNGELKNAGIKKGFIITVVNDQKIYSPEQLEKLVENVLRGSVDG